MGRAPEAREDAGAQFIAGGPDRGRPRRGRTLVLGIGNSAAGDDGFGPAVVRALSDEDLPGCELAAGGVLGIDLLSEIEDYDELILIDAVRARGEDGVVPVPAEETRGKAGERGRDYKAEQSGHWGERPGFVSGEVVVFRLSEVELADSDPRFSLHDLSFGGCLRLARILGLRLPEIQVVGLVLPPDSSLDGPELGPAADRAVPVAAAQVRALLGSC